MQRPCEHTEPEPGCSICRVFLTNPEHHRAWGGTQIDRIGPCAHLGAETGEQSLCGTCKGSVRIKLKMCAVHGKCSEVKPLPGVACCVGCKDYVSPIVGTFGTEEPIRNLIYVVYPANNNGVWQRNVAQLVKRIKLFNGRRVVAILTGPGCDPAEHVRDAFAGHVHEFLELQNDNRGRWGGVGEVVAFLPLMERVESLSKNQVTFYAHAKGVSRPKDEGVTVHDWASVLYETSLDYWPLVRRELAKFPIVGSLKRSDSMWPWHYSGTFYWFRNKDAFSRNWRDVPQNWGGVEQWPGKLYDIKEGGCLFMNDTGEMYDKSYMNYVIKPHLEVWRQAYAADRKEW
jgi:hypothetical protein